MEILSGLGVSPDLGQECVDGLGDVVYTWPANHQSTLSAELSEKARARGQANADDPFALLCPRLSSTQFSPSLRVGWYAGIGR
jgi:hypothetical protein